MILVLRNGEMDEIDEKLVVLKEDGKELRKKVREAVRELLSRSSIRLL